MKQKKLSVRELEVLTLLKKGYKSRDVAKELKVNEKTISTYLNRLSKKLNIPKDMNLYGVITIADQLGMVAREGKINTNGDKAYRVTWTVELNAPDDLEAALLALQIQRDISSEALAFVVTELKTGENIHVDLNE